jgi:hypothetical protein
VCVSLKETAFLYPSEVSSLLYRFCCVSKTQSHNEFSVQREDIRSSNYVMSFKALSENRLSDQAPITGNKAALLE